MGSPGISALMIALPFLLPETFWSGVSTALGADVQAPIVSLSFRIYRVGRVGFK